ncbi:MAG: hypothetical protein R2828_22080 [Saprospiraceae bacterium]
MDKEKTYQPISCSYYDHLEALATLRKKVTIHYLNSAGVATSIQAIIKDFFVKDKVEFMVLDDGTTIRLDQLIDVDGQVLSSYC